jgi:O-antigen/teichoic acid export membrane protein
MKPGRWRSRLRHGLRSRVGEEARGLAADSGYVAIWQGAISVADLVQIILITHALGLAGYGRFALVVAFVTAVSRFFDVRVGTAATIFGARRLRRGVQSTAEIFRLSYLIDALTGVVALVVVAAAAPLVAPHLIGSDGTTMALLYALALFAVTLEDSSIAILRLFDRFRVIAGGTIALEGLRVGLVLAALAVHESLTAVFIALLLYKIVTGVAQLVAATIVFRRAGGGFPFGRVSLRSAGDDGRQMIRMVFHTNVVSYARLAQVQLPTILLGAISSVTQVGAYKVGMAAASMLGKVADFAYVALVPRLSRLWAAGRRLEVRRLIGRVSLVSVPIMAVGVVVLVLARDPILKVLGGSSAASAAGTVLILGATAQGLNNAVFWNTPLLFVTGRSRAIAILSVIAVVSQVALLVPLAAAADATGAAIAFLVSMVWLNTVMTALALRVIRAEDGQTKSEPVTQDVAGALTLSRQPEPK